jgi:ABC-type sulfate/molybdate transport systems ATPase subunit
LSLLEIAGLDKRFGAVPALVGLDLRVEAGEFLALLGGSGSGKSTLLRLIAGFEAPDAGSIHLGGQDLTAMPPHARPLNMMFQSYALFPHLSVGNNVAYGLRREGTPRAERDRRVEEALAMVGMGEFAGRMPHRLSGGQRQRVALARALVKRPRLLLLDEPLGALDANLRERTGFELRALQRRTGASFIMVTHDQQEALALADRVAVLEQGRLVQAGPPRACMSARPHASSPASSAVPMCWKGRWMPRAGWTALGLAPRCARRRPCLPAPPPAPCGRSASRSAKPQVTPIRRQAWWRIWPSGVMTACCWCGPPAEPCCASATRRRTGRRPPLAAR